jgi:PII-like signaling protein
MSENALLKVFVPENHSHKGELLFEWVLEQAKALGIPGGTAFRAIAGYGRHGHLHHESYIDMAPNLPVQVQLVATQEQARLLLDLLRSEQVNAFYVLSPVEVGFTATSR